MFCSLPAAGRRPKGVICFAHRDFADGFLRILFPQALPGARIRQLADGLSGREKLRYENVIDQKNKETQKRINDTLKTIPGNRKVEMTDGTR
jgi:hypothetical protein